MATEKWKDFEKEEFKDILVKINDLHPVELYDEETSRIQYRKLPFYKDRVLVQATEFAAHPPMKMRFLQSTEDKTLEKIDGSREGLFDINSKSKMRITKRNVVKYAKFFMSSVMTEEGSFRIVENMEEIEFSDEPTDEQIKILENNVDFAKVEEKQDGFCVKCVMLYSDAVYKADLLVESNGGIEIEEEDVVASGMPTRQIFLR
jgi:hypothetical protein